VCEIGGGGDLCEIGGGGDLCEIGGGGDLCECVMARTGGRWGVCTCVCVSECVNRSWCA